MIQVAAVVSSVAIGERCYDCTKAALLFEWGPADYDGRRLFHPRIVQWPTVEMVVCSIRSYFHV